MSNFVVTPWTVAHQISLSMGFSRQEHWSGVPFPPPGELPDPGVEPSSLNVFQRWQEGSSPPAPSVSHLGFISQEHFPNEFTSGDGKKGASR